MARFFSLSVICSLCLLIGCASKDVSQPFGANQSLTIFVGAIGSSLMETQKIANRNAIQEAFGAVMLSERRVINDNLYEDDVSYSKGIIEKSVMIRHYRDSRTGLFHADYQVTVSSSIIEKRLLYLSDSKALDGRGISAKITQGLAQADSEVERHLKARALLMHLVKGLPDSLFSVRSGEVKTTREGYAIKTKLTVHADVDESTLNSVRYATEQYRLTLLPSVPNQYKNLIGVLEVNKPGLLSEDSYFALVDKDIYQIIEGRLKGMGICLSFLDANKTLIKKHFIHTPAKRGDDFDVASRLGATSYVVNFLENNQGLHRRSRSGNDRVGGHYIGIDGYGITYAKDIKYDVELPNMTSAELVKLKEISSKIGTQSNC